MDYMLRGFDPDKDRDIVFIPVGINYDRTLEDRSLLRALDPGAHRRGLWFVTRTTLRFVARSLVLMVLSRWRRYGYACVNFGTPISARTYCREQGLWFHRMPRSERFPEIERLCRCIMAGIAAVVPVLPVAMLARIFLEAGEQGLDIPEIERRFSRLLNELAERGAPVFEVHGSTRARLISEALHMLLLRRLVREDNAIYQAAAGEGMLLTYYANAIAHYWRPAVQQSCLTALPEGVP
jgi:glycerol-3-phosphate O-acyltransferase